MVKNLRNLKFIALGLAFAFLVNSLGVLPLAQAQDFVLPKPGTMVSLSPAFAPPMLKGIKVHPDNPFRFEFILDKGDSRLGNDQLKDESTRLIKYFLASLTIPEKDLWVNLSPYEKNRIVPESFGQTEMGRDLLAEDYMLKQITASLIYPEGETGKKFWQRIYAQAAKRFGTTNIPVNTFNKVWILPQKAVVYENAKAGTAYVVESKLKVMLEQDYLSLQKHEGILSGQAQAQNSNQLGSQVVREIVIPELTKEVNYGQNFTQLRQVYNSLILATWYKKKIKDSILEQVYTDKNKVAGVNINDPQEKERIYQRYLQAFKKGAYNYIKEEIDPVTQETIPRKYFSGGEELIDVYAAMSFTTRIPSEPVADKAILSVNIEGADQAMIDLRDIRQRGRGGRSLQEIVDVLKASGMTKEQWQELVTQVGRTIRWMDVKGRDDLAVIKLMMFSGDSPREFSNEISKEIGDQLGGGQEQKEQNYGKGKREAVEARRVKELEILAREPEPITISGLLGLLKKEDGYADVKAETVRSDVALDDRLKGHAKIKKELDREAVEARRVKELEILEREPEPITISGLLGLLKKEDGYADVKAVDVRNDVALDDRLKGHAKLNIKELDREAVEARRVKELEILAREPEPITISGLLGLLKKEDGYADVKAETVRSDVALDDRLKGHAKIKKELDREAVEARRVKELEILAREPEPITISGLLGLLKKEDGYADVKAETVRSDVDRDDRLKGHAKLNIKELDREAVEARRVKELEILAREPEPITISGLLGLLKKEDGYADVKAETVRSDVDRDDRLKGHAKLNIKELDREAVEARRVKELEILAREPEPITISGLLGLLKKEDGYADVKAVDVRNDVALDDRLKGHAKLNIKELDREAVEARRVKELEILAREPEPITISGLLGLLKKEDGYADVKAVDVRNDVALDERLKGHAKLNIKELDREAVEARRVKELEILEREPEPITISGLLGLLKKEDGYADVKAETVRSDVALDDRLKGHAKIKKELDREAVEARRVKELEILAREPEPITISGLLGLLKKEDGYADVKAETVRSDVDRDDRLKGHAKLNIKELDREAVEARRVKELEILAREPEPITISGLLGLLKKEDGYADVKAVDVRNDVARDDRLKGHAKLNIKERERNLGDIFILLEGSDQNLLNSIESELEDGGYNVTGIVRGQRHIESKLKENPKINFVISEGDVDKRIIGKRKFINLGNYLDQDEELKEEKSAFFDEVDRLSGQDNAQVANGGIDLTPANMNLQTGSTNGDIFFHINPAMLSKFQNTPGFVPVVIDYEPLISLKQFLEQAA